MAIGIGDHHEELGRAVRRWVQARCPTSVAREALEATDEAVPPFWGEICEQGWLSVHLDESDGGQGGGFLELATVIEELARAVVPGPCTPSALAMSVISCFGTPQQRKDLLPKMIDGTTPGALALPGSGTLEGRRANDGTISVSGVIRPVLGANLAKIVVAPVVVGGAGSGSPWDVREPGAGDLVGSTGDVIWCALSAHGTGPSPGDGSVANDEGHRSQFSAQPIDSFDPLRRVASVVVSGASVPPSHQIEVTGSAVLDLALAVFAAECAGGARWCLETATEHAKTRHQFGRPIGQFQAVKHRLADMLVLVEQTTATAWDAAQAVDWAAGCGWSPEAVEQMRLSCAIAGAIALDAYVECAKGAIQILGGMGFTWEHDAHLHLRRAVTLRQLVGGSDPMRSAASRLALGGARRALAIELPPDAEAVREVIRPLVAQIAQADGRERRRLMVEHGLVAPHWPAPYGRGAGAVEQIVIEQELAAFRVSRPMLAVGAWALPTIIAHGTPEQHERWVVPTLMGELTWCQLFSEPGAGSDLASLSTRATRVENWDGPRGTESGWLLDGQKVWTSVAAKADWGICLARTDPDAPKHAGITYFVVDMHSPGIEVRPLREITGEAMFNEVFLTQVFVPDDCVIGEVNGGWRLARTTLANERVSMSSGMTFGWGIEAILGWLSGRPHVAEDAVVLARLGALLAEAQSLALLGHRTTLRSVSGVDPGPEASVRKLLGAEHEQRVQEMGLMLLGPEGATTEGDAAIWSRGFLSTRCLTIAGGTSEVQRNVIGQRILGLPRDPEPA